MSRTYRCRHLPPTRDWNGSLISKVSDGSRGCGWRARWDAAREQVEAEFGPRPRAERMVHVRGLTHRVWHRAVYRTTTICGKPWKMLVKPDWYEILPGRRMKTWEAWAWDQEVDRAVAAMDVPISSWHPLQRRPYAGSRKKFERVQANRGMRRVARQTLRAGTLDDDWDGHMPSRRTYFNWRSVY